MTKASASFYIYPKVFQRPAPVHGPEKMWNGTVFENREDACVYDEELGVPRMADVTLTIVHNGKCIKLADEEINHFISALNQLQSYIERDNQEEKAKEVSSG